MMAWMRVRRIEHLKIIVILPNGGCARRSNLRGVAIRRWVLSRIRARPAGTIVVCLQSRARYPARDSRANNVSVGF